MCGTLNWTAAKDTEGSDAQGFQDIFLSIQFVNQRQKTLVEKGMAGISAKAVKHCRALTTLCRMLLSSKRFRQAPSFMPLNLSEPSGSAKIQVLRCSALRSHQHQIPRMFLKPSKFDKNQHTIFQYKFSSTDFFPHRIGLLAIEGLRGQVTSISGVQTMVRYTNKFSLNPKIWTKKLWPAAWSWRTRQIPKLNISLSARDQLEKPTKCSGRKGIIS